MGQDTPEFPNPDPVGMPMLLARNLGIKEAVKLGFLPAGDFPTGRDVQGNHSTPMREIEAAGTVFLKNVNGTPPLATPRLIGVFEKDGTDFSDGLNGGAIGASGGASGTLSIGGGRGSGRYTNIVPPLEAIKTKARDTGTTVQDITNDSLLTDEIIKAISHILEVCLVFLKSYAEEGSDRRSFEADGNSTGIV